MRLYTVIYGLFDPRQPKIICYVGSGRQPDPAANHWNGFCNSGYACNGRLRCWFQKLQKEGYGPQWRMLENVKSGYTKDGLREAGDAREEYWIRYWQKRNPKICNIWGLDVSLPGGAYTSRDFRLRNRSSGPEPLGRSEK
jgi:hypothetical protein